MRTREDIAVNYNSIVFGPAPCGCCYNVKDCVNMAGSGDDYCGVTLCKSCLLKIAEEFDAV